MGFKFGAKGRLLVAATGILIGLAFVIGIINAWGNFSRGQTGLGVLSLIGAAVPLLLLGAVAITLIRLMQTSKRQIAQGSEVLGAFLGQMVNPNQPNLTNGESAKAFKELMGGLFPPTEGEDQ